MTNTSALPLAIKTDSKTILAPSGDQSALAS
jgi:hypothetical protein